MQPNAGTAHAPVPQTSFERNAHALLEELRQRNARRVLLQAPEGLRTSVIALASLLGQSGISTVISCDATYGACDLADKEAQAMQCDLLVHIGHSKFYRDFGTAVPVLYFPWNMRASLDGADFSSIHEEHIGIVTTVQHTDLLSEVRDLLVKAGKKPFFAGNILGCYTLPAQKIESNVDAFLFVGSGKFHPLGMRGKPVYTFDLETKAVEKLDTALFEKRRFAAIYKAKDAKTFGIIVSTKEGQRELLGAAERVRQQLEEKDKKAYVLIMDEVTSAKLEGLKVDAFVNTACPRIMDDHFAKPLINAEDIEYL
ncbi:MAG: diphthamide biosynthesis enzyme Dph2 [Candidatus Aenigmarchaeota archaeon]|nr:diphthamide biosynthesis enzyme Dph2 [Candidatus Aenigmarchaeota archaeon]